MAPQAGFMNSVWVVLKVENSPDVYSDEFVRHITTDDLWCVHRTEAGAKRRAGELQEDHMEDGRFVVQEWELNE